ncbi:hypothetical protein D3C73_1317880 [compost metagenome]
MRVDFRFQRFEHRVFLDDFHFIAFIDQFVRLLHHLIEMARQVSDLIIPLHSRLGIEAAGAEAFHLQGQILQRTGDPVRDKADKNDRSNQEEQADRIT